MVEEFRLSLFAQDLRTLLPVSAKRLDEQLQLALREAVGHRRGARSARSKSALSASVYTRRMESARMTADRSES